MQTFDSITSRHFQMPAVSSVAGDPSSNHGTILFYKWGPNQQ